MNEKRRLPRYVDGRIKVGLMPIKNFIKTIPFLAFITVFTITFINPVTLFIGTICGGIIVGLFSEFNNKETGLDILKDSIRYRIEGNKYFERSGANVEELKKITYSNIKEK